MQKSAFFESVFAIFTILLLIIVAISTVLLELSGSVAYRERTGVASESVAVSPPAEDQEAAVTPRDGQQNTRKDGVENFLICGKDRASGLYDVIVLAQLDTKKCTASLVQIPRDTYAAYTENDYRKLNGAASALGGIDRMADFLSASFGIPIDHYISLDLDCVGEIVDAIGGVTLEIPQDMDYEDSAQGLSIHLKAGKQTLNGDMAEQFLRYRSGYVTADLGRLDAQKSFVSAFLTEIKHASLPRLLYIARTLYTSVRTDLSFGEIAKLVSVGIKLRTEAVTMTTLPGEATRTGVDSGAWYYVIRRKDAYRVISEQLSVSDTPLAESDFDPLARFTNQNYAHFEAIYQAS